MNPELKKNFLMSDFDRLYMISCLNYKCAQAIVKAGIVADKQFGNEFIIIHKPGQLFYNLVIEWLPRRPYKRNS